VHLADGLVLEGEVLAPQGDVAHEAAHALGMEHLVVGHDGVALDRLLAHRARLKIFLVMVIDENSKFHD